VVKMPFLSRAVAIINESGQKEVDEKSQGK
jgi:hypothetical protein